MKKSLLIVLSVIILLGAGFAAGAYYFSPKTTTTASLEDSVSCPIYLPAAIRDSGVDADRVLVAKNAAAATIYLRFSRPFSGTVLLEAFDRASAEIGRSRAAVAGTTDEARYFVFEFSDEIPLKTAESFKLVFATETADDVPAASETAPALSVPETPAKTPEATVPEASGKPAENAPAA